MRKEFERHGAAAVEAAGKLAKNAQPGKRSRTLTLGDHDDALYSIECSALSGLTVATPGVLVNTANLIGLALSGRRQGDRWYSTAEGVHSGLWAALKEAESAGGVLTDARLELHKEVTRCEAAAGTPLAKLAERTPGRNLVRRHSEATGEALKELGAAVNSHRNALGNPVSPPALLADVAVVVTPLITVLTYLESALGHEAILIDWLYEDAKAAARAEKVSGSLLEAGRRLAKARRQLDVIYVVVRDVSDEDEG